jgi:hypothetical protein
MYNVDVTLIKIITKNYYIKKDKIVNKLNHKGRTFFDKYERVDTTLSRAIMNDHDEKKVIVAHSLINDRDKVENIVFDYNGRNTEKFWHRVQLLLREEGYLNFTAYESKTSGHLHVYVHKGHTTLQEAYQIAQKLSTKLATKLPREWKMFPNADIPREFNILNLPYKVYAKERGSSWAKHM